MFSREFIHGHGFDIVVWTKLIIFNSVDILIGVVAAATAASLSTWMFVGVRGNQGLPGCGSGSACDAVARGRWARWGPISVAGLGSVFYILLGFLIGIEWRTGSAAVGDAIRCLSFMAVGSAIWFMALQLVVIRKLCIYCTVTHGCGAAAALIMLHRLWSWNTSTLLTELSIAGTGLTALIGGQLLLKPRTFAVLDLPAKELAEKSPDEQHGDGKITSDLYGRTSTSRRVHFLAGKVEADLLEFPLLGSSEALHVVALLFDFTCDECHHLMQMLTQLVPLAQGRLAVLIVPVPLHKSCNPEIECDDFQYKISCQYTRLNWAVWITAAAQHPLWLDFVCSDDTPRPFGLALLKAKEIADISQYDLKESHPEQDAKIAAAVEIYRKVGKPPLPTMLLPVGMLRGRVPDTQTLRELLEKHVDQGIFERVVPPLAASLTQTTLSQVRD